MGAERPWNLPTTPDGPKDVRQFRLVAHRRLDLVHGIGPPKPRWLLPPWSWAKKQHGQARIGTQVTSSRDVHRRFVSRLGDLQHEEFWVVLLKRSNHVLAELCISRGGLTGTVVDPKVVFGRALAMRAAAMVLVHNHPSGNPKPSAADRSSQPPCKAGEFLDLPVLDHVIVGGDAFVNG